MKKLFVYLPVLLIVVGISVAVILLNKNKSSDKGSEVNTQNEVEKKEGTITVEAGQGTLVNGGTFSYIDESARGLEAYLGDKGASAVYEFTGVNGEYSLWVKLTDDGLYTVGTRNATIVVNNLQTLVFQHVPEDTKGWKWYEIGNTTLLDGSNTISFTKDADTAGAYVMDEFIFIPK